LESVTCDAERSWQVGNIFLTALPQNNQVTVMPFWTNLRARACGFCDVARNVSRSFRLPACYAARWSGIVIVDSGNMSARGVSSRARFIGVGFSLVEFRASLHWNKSGRARAQLPRCGAFLSP